MFERSWRMGQLVVVGIIAAVVNTVPLGAQSGPRAGLRIVVIEGEDAVNIVQQRTAVAPVVEVRDRNDQPVAGAVVRFVVSKGRATFSGVRAVSVTTNAAGRAVAAGLTPTGSGALQIGASAAFQGQTAVATIVQTNVMTVAQAAAVSGAAGSAGGAGSGGAAGGGAGAAGGGGISGTTVGLVGGAVAGGTLAAKEVIGGDGGVVTYSGPYSGQTTDTFTFNGGCARTIDHVGRVSVDIKVASDGAVTGTGGTDGTMTLTSTTCTGGSPANALNSVQMHGCCLPDAQVQGTTSGLTWSGSHPGNSSTNWTYTFTGTLSGTTIIGTYRLVTTGPGIVSSGGTFPVTLSKE